MPPNDQTRHPAPYLPFRVDVTDPVRESYSLMGSDKALELVRRVVRGDVSYRELSTVGFEVTLDPPTLSGPSMQIAELPLRDLATGLLHHWTLGPTSMTGPPSC